MPLTEQAQREAMRQRKDGTYMCVINLSGTNCRGRAKVQYSYCEKHWKEFIPTTS